MPSDKFKNIKHYAKLYGIRVLNYNESSVAYIDFGYEEEADYFVKAIDKTPFGMILISSTRVESYNPT